MKLINFSTYLDKLEKTSSRLEITKILSELLSKSDIKEIDKVTYLSLGILAPNYESLILNLAEKMMIRVIAMAFGEDEVKVRNLYKEIGDIGNTAENLSKNLNFKINKDLSVIEVYEKLKDIAEDSGAGSQDRKIEKMSNILKEIDPLSARFIARIPVGRLRLGFSEKTIIDSLSQIGQISVNKIEEAYNIRPDIGYIVKLVKEDNLKKAKPEIGVPVVPMLAARLNSPSDMIKKMGEVSVEPKFDGLRVFIHYKRSMASQSPGKKPNIVRIFTRNMNEVPLDTFPELKEVGQYIKANEVILDSEGIGIDEEREKFLDFQKTIQRRRKHEVGETASEIPLQFQVFDILLKDGESFINKPYLERRRELMNTIISGKILRVDENTVTEDPEIIRELHQKYLKMGLEGVVVKRANAGYVSGRTGWNWVKMKEVEGTRGKLSDTIDSVVMGFTSGKGKRVGFGVGQFLAGIKDGDTYKTITKVGTGLTDEQFKELNIRLSEIVSKEKPKDFEVNKDLEPDYWVIPKVVVELAADEITVSPKHTAGLALRFPRLVKFRDDRSAEQVTTLEEFKEIFKLQKKN